MKNSVSITHRLSDVPPGEVIPNPGLDFTETCDGHKAGPTEATVTCGIVSSRARVGLLQRAAMAAASFFTAPDECSKHAPGLLPD